MAEPTGLISDRIIYPDTDGDCKLVCVRGQKKI